MACLVIQLFTHQSPPSSIVDSPSGFPEVSYGKYCGILVSKGYRVARVEQTETPEMLKERNDAACKGKKDKVVAREMCSIMSKGHKNLH